MRASRPAIGVILPSSNRTVERVTRRILEDHPGFDACFARVPYAGHPADGYDLDAFRSAATLLAEAKPGIIVWNATRGASLGFEPDRALRAMIAAETGIPATTTPLALLNLLRARGLRRIAMIAQGDAAYTANLRGTFAREDIDIIADVSLDIADNFAAAWVAPETLEAAALELADSKPDAVLIWSTNLPGHGVAETLDDRLGLPVIDSAALGITEPVRDLKARGADKAA